MTPLQERAPGRRTGRPLPRDAGARAGRVGPEMTRVKLLALLARRPSDPLDAFTQIHLSTRAERAVFRRFARDPLASWSEAEIASAAGLEASEVTWALERFKEAGIVELVERRYRWRPELRYVFERRAPRAAHLDPVCGMPVAPDTPLRAEDLLGRMECFCCERCMAAFLLWPLAFMRAPDPEGTLEGDAADR